MTFKFATYSANAGQQVISQNVSVGSLPDKSKLVVELDINSNSSSDEDSSLANSTQIPMYYVEENKTWTNDGCSLEAGEQNASLGNKSQIYNSTSIRKRISCNTIGKKQKITPRVALIIAVDVIKNVWNAIKGGNYQMLINFGSLTNLSATNSGGLIIGLGIILAISICSIILKIKDNQALYLARVDALNAYFENRSDTEIKEEGFLVDLKNFFAEIRKKGFLNSQSTIANQSKNDQAQITPSGEKKVEKSTTPVISLVNKPKKAPLAPKPNGFTILTKKEEKELKALYATMKYEALPIYGRMKTLENFKDEISENKILSRKTITYLENMKEQKQTTFFGLLITQHPLLSVFFVLSLSTPRYINLIILGLSFLGQLFTTGYFFNAKDTLEISDDASKFVTDAVIVSIASILLMIPVKLTVGFFLIDKPPKDTSTIEDIERSERRKPTLQKIGVILSFVWLSICAWGITMFSINFETIAMKKWLSTYFVCFGSELTITTQCKILMHVIIGAILMKIAKAKIMLTCAGAIAGKIIDKIFAWF